MKTVPLGGKKAAGRVALVDDEDYSLVIQYRWHVHEELRTGGSGGPYARAVSPGQGLIFMHRLLAAYPRPDHIDGDGLNNQRSNLRPATPAQNNMNRRKRPGASSRYKGVTWHVRKRRWRARIYCNKVARELGFFTSETAAALAYDAAARELFGEYARPNFPR